MYTLFPFSDVSGTRSYRQATVVRERSSRDLLNLGSRSDDGFPFFLLSFYTARASAGSSGRVRWLHSLSFSFLLLS